MRAPGADGEPDGARRAVAVGAFSERHRQAGAVGKLVLTVVGLDVSHCCLLGAARRREGRRLVTKRTGVWCAHEERYGRRAPPSSSAGRLFAVLPPRYAAFGSLRRGVDRRRGLRPPCGDDVEAVVAQADRGRRETGGDVAGECLVCVDQPDRAARRQSMRSRAGPTRAARTGGSYVCIGAPLSSVVDEHRSCRRYTCLSSFAGRHLHVIREWYARSRTTSWEVAVSARVSRLPHQRLPVPSRSAHRGRQGRGRETSARCARRSPRGTDWSRARRSQRRAQRSPRPPGPPSRCRCTDCLCRTGRADGRADLIDQPAGSTSGAIRIKSPAPHRHRRPARRRRVRP